MTLPTAEDLPAAAPSTDDADEEAIRDELPCACGYDLRGLARFGRCPECGEDVAAAIRWRDNPLGPPAVIRRMIRGLIVVLAAYVAWLGVLFVRGMLEGPDRWAYWATGISGLKTFIVPASFITSQPALILTWLIAACHVVHLVGVLLLTTPPAPGRAPALRWRAVTLRWTSVAAVPLVAIAFWLWTSRYQEMLGWLSAADAIIGLAWGLYLVGIARSLGRARWMSIGGRIIAIGSIGFGWAFAFAFLVMSPQQEYWETLIRTSLIGWAAVGVLCTVLLVSTWRRLRRDLRAMTEAPLA